jgi:hypothetical protein
LHRSLIVLAALAPFAAPAPTGAQPSAADWSALAELPDFSGVWVPDVADQRRKERNERPPWTEAAQAQIDFLFAEDRAGRPKLILDHCLPHGMPSWMLITHNALEILATPGRMQSYIALSEAVGIPNNGGMHIVERIRLRDPDTLGVELAITAPKVLTGTWTTTRLLVRQRGLNFDIVEGQCVQGALVEAEDEHGNAIFEHAPPPEDGRVPTRERSE